MVATLTNATPCGYLEERAVHQTRLAFELFRRKRSTSHRLIAISLLAITALAALAIPHFHPGNPPSAPGNGNSGNGGKTGQGGRQNPLPPLPSLPPSLPDSAKPTAQPGKT